MFRAALMSVRMCVCCVCVFEWANSRFVHLTNGFEQCSISNASDSHIIQSLFDKTLFLSVFLF